MLEIDGSEGEGGGQILRTSLSLAALTGKEIKINNIRSSRPSPGLKPQHIAGVNALANICSAEVSGVFRNSHSLSFKPEKISDSRFAVKIGTAGSISLLLQQILPASLPVDCTVRIEGGTSVKWAPTITYLNKLLFPVLNRAGAKLSLKLISTGFFPKGNGSVSFTSKKSSLPLKPITLLEQGSLQSIECFSFSSSLPQEVSRNQALGAKNFLKKSNLSDFDWNQEIKAEPNRSNTIGSSVSLFAKFSDGSIIGASSIGQKGIPAEQIGEQAAKNLLAELGPAKPVDSHLADQLIPFMAIANGKSEIQCTALSQHTLTNISVCEKILGCKFEVVGGMGQPAKISVQGISFAP